jgi:hypothetical protein
MGEDGAPNTLASQLMPPNTVWSCESVAFVTEARAPERWVMKTIGAAPTDTVEATGIVVPVKGSLPVMLKAKTCAVDVLAG